LLHSGINAPARAAGALRPRPFWMAARLGGAHHRFPQMISIQAAQLLRSARQCDEDSAG